jgi:surfactin synthase thioesterase subunit
MSGMVSAVDMFYLGICVLYLLFGHTVGGLVGCSVCRLLSIAVTIPSLLQA